MIQVKFDGTFDGLLTAIFEVYAQKLKLVSVISQDKSSLQLFGHAVDIATDIEKSKRVQAQIERYIGKSGLNSLWKATLTESESVPQVIFEVVQYMLEKKGNVLGDFGHPAVLELQQFLKKLSRERHRMTAFVRFELATDGIYYATIEPDFDVLPIVSDHFKSRYADQKWLIFDTKRNYGIYYNLMEVYPIEINQEKGTGLPALAEISWDASEKEFQQLWKNYFKSTNILSRKNTKLHLQHVPKRYWKYLTEKQI